MDREEHHKLAVQVFSEFYELRNEIIEDTGHELIWNGKKLVIGIPTKDDNGEKRLIIVSAKTWVANLNNPKRRKRLRKS